MKSQRLLARMAQRREQEAAARTAALPAAAPSPTPALTVSTQGAAAEGEEAPKKKKGFSPSQVAAAAKAKMTGPAAKSGRLAGAPQSALFEGDQEDDQERPLFDYQVRRMECVHDEGQAETKAKQVREGRQAGRQRQPMGDWQWSNI